MHAPATQESIVQGLPSSQLMHSGSQGSWQAPPQQTWPAPQQEPPQQAFTQHEPPQQSPAQQLPLQHNSPPPQIVWHEPPEQA
jgi:hypothetical protein